MKTRINFFTLIVALSITVMAKSQSDSSYTKTLFNGTNQIESGGYGAFSVKGTQIDNQPSLLIGGRGGWVANHKYVIGLAGYSIMSNEFKLSGANYNSFYTGGYGGLYLETILFSNKLVNLSIPLELGAGKMVRVDDKNADFGTSFLYAEPGIEVDLNVSKGFKVSLGTYYKFTGKIGNSNTLSNGLLDGLSVGLQFKWGKF